MATVPKNIELHTSSITKSMTARVKIVGYRRWYMRVRIGLILIRFAVWLMGMGFEVVDEE